VNRSLRLYEALKTDRLIGLLAPESASQCLAAYEVLDPLGVVLEVAFRTAAAAEGLRLVLDRHPGALVMAGTVMTAEQARQAIAAGAAGIVSADYVPSVVEACVAADVMSVPGGLADCGKQLAQKAALYGCGPAELKDRHPYQWIYKLFPAATESLVLSELALAWRGPFPGLMVVHTGGVSRRNLARLAAIDPEGVFCGSALTAGLDRGPESAGEARAWRDILARTGSVNPNG
jgi:2-keto-3-deoxy-6-phosphogluconate aldolase